MLGLLAIVVLRSRELVTALYCHTVEKPLTNYFLHCWCCDLFLVTVLHSSSCYSCCCASLKVPFIKMLFPLVLFSFVALLGFSEEQATNSTAAGAQTCYNFDGTPFADNVQCPGSSVCCGSLNQCVSQRFCERDGDLIRPVCTTYPWNSDECSGLCLYGMSTLRGTERL